MDANSKKLLKKVLRAVGLVLVKSRKKCSAKSLDPNEELMAVKPLRCIRAEDAKSKKKKMAVAVHFIDKDGEGLFWRFFAGAWRFEDEVEVIEKLGEAREFMRLDESKLACISIAENALRWNNPLFGCKSLEEMAIRSDLDA